MAAVCMQAIWTQENTQNELAGSAVTKAAAPKDEVEAALADVSGRRLAGRIGPQSGDSFEECSAVTNWTDANFLQVLRREAREDPLVDLVVAEGHLVFFEAQAPQPDHDIHDGAPNQGCRTSSCGTQRASRGGGQSGDGGIGLGTPGCLSAKPICHCALVLAEMSSRP